jgi:hypothetical protein
LKEGQSRQDIIWGAQHNPENTMFSAVFNFKPNDPQCMPTNFRAGDVVPQGASTTALFSDATPTPTMDIQELITLLDDPKCKDAIRAIVKSHQDTADDSAAAEMESDAGVTDDDKKKEDDQKPALMRAALRSIRAIKRQNIKSLADQETAILEKAKAASAADATALLGRAGFPGIGAGKKDEEAYTATLSKYKDTANGNEVVAVRRMLHDHPELASQWEASQRAKCAKLVPTAVS